MDRVSGVGLRLLLAERLPAFDLPHTPAGLDGDWSDVDHAARWAAQIGAAPVRPRSISSTQEMQAGPEHGFKENRRGAGVGRPLAFDKARFVPASASASASHRVGVPIPARVAGKDSRAGGAYGGETNRRSARGEYLHAPRSGPRVQTGSRAGRVSTRAFRSADLVSVVAKSPGVTRAAIRGAREVVKSGVWGERLRLPHLVSRLGSPFAQALRSSSELPSVRFLGGLTRGGESAAKTWILPSRSEPFAPHAATGSGPETRHWSGLPPSSIPSVSQPSSIPDGMVEASPPMPFRPNVGTSDIVPPLFGFSGPDAGSRAMIDEMARLATRPPAGLTGFDAARAPAWLGGWMGGL